MPVRSIYIDVDDTLINDQDKLFPGVLEKLENWAVRYTTIVCWSHSGAEHARRVCKKHKIDKFFTHFLDKPDVIVDDNPGLILSFPAILEVRRADKWWLQSDHKLFECSRNWIEEHAKGQSNDGRPKEDSK